MSNLRPNDPYATTPVHRLRRDISTYLLVAAGVPVGDVEVACHIEWRMERDHGDLAAERRSRIRARKANRAPFVYTPNDVSHKPHRITLGGASSGRA